MHLLLVTLGEMPDEPLRGRIVEVGIGLLKLIEEHSRSYHVVFATLSKDVIAYAMDLKSPPWKVTNAFRSLSRVQLYDKCLLVELGHDHSDSGMNVATTWLKRTQSQG